MFFSASVVEIHYVSLIGNCLGEDHLSVCCRTSLFQKDRPLEKLSKWQFIQEEQKSDKEGGAPRQEEMTNGLPLLAFLQCQSVQKGRFAVKKRTVFDTDRWEMTIGCSKLMHCWVIGA